MEEVFLQRWSVTEHEIPAAHIRGFARGVVDEEKHRLRLAVKHYVPKGREPAPGDATLVFAHGVGSTKESYEPFFDELLSLYPAIRSVWIPDIAWHGDSYLLNEDAVGEEPHWADSARDLIQMINHFQAQMPPPIVAVAQSWGAFTVLSAAMWHPRLFAGLAIMEPTVIASMPGQNDKTTFAYGMIFKKDTWATREEARTYLLKNPYYGAFDSAVFERVVKYDLRDVVIDGSPAVTLKTPKSMEVYSMMRSWPPLPGVTDSPEERLLELEARGEYTPTLVIKGFHRPEIQPFLKRLPDILPPVHIVWAGRSYHKKIPGYRDVLFTIGTGPDGSGGAAKGKVTETLVEDSGHPLPLEKPALGAGAVAPWLAQCVKEWKEAAARRRDGARQFTKVVNPGWVIKAEKL
ncbi:toxin biosynthesis protein [Thozetella sp. PMI_491]|nr:toxin biosynthesis protein [Thozetella sp. PMI_491]